MKKKKGGFAFFTKGGKRICTCSQKNETSGLQSMTGKHITTENQGKVCKESMGISPNQVEMHDQQDGN